VGEAQSWLFEPEFNRAVKVRTTDERITSDAGLLLLREADHRLGLTEYLAGQLIDPRRPDRIRYEIVELLRERLYGLALGYATQDDAAAAACLRQRTATMLTPRTCRAAAFSRPCRASGVRGRYARKCPRLLTAHFNAHHTLD
jgi:hypothetical protein